MTGLTPEERERFLDAIGAERIGGPPSDALRPVTTADLRELARRLQRRPNAPSLDGYTLADGLIAAAELLDGRPGPDVHPNCVRGSDAYRPHVPLSKLLPRKR